MKVIFLDFDGVITTYKTAWFLDASKMRLLKQIVDATDAYIVISSSWRRHTLEDTINSITNKGNVYVGDNPFICPERVVGITSRMYGFKFGERETHYKVCRGVEIDRYLSENLDIDSYVILDDYPDMLLSQKDNFIHVDGNNGLSKSDVKKAINILNNIC